LNSVNLIGARAYFNPALQFGRNVQISGSDQVAANGTWMIYDIKHRLSSQYPKGPWFSEFTAQPPQGFVKVPG
jgi:hypothetical protein